MAKQLCSPLVVLCVIFKAYAEGVCEADIIVPRFKEVVCVGHSFNLSCQFLCLSPSDRGQLKHNDELLLEKNVTTPNSTLSYYVAVASIEHNGTYHCQTEPKKTISPDLIIYIIDTCEAAENNSEVKTMETVHISKSYLLVVWYLLCKAGVFFLFIMFALIPKCHIC